MAMRPQVQTPMQSKLKATLTATQNSITLWPRVRTTMQAQAMEPESRQIRLIRLVTKTMMIRDNRCRRRTHSVAGTQCIQYSQQRQQQAQRTTVKARTINSTSPYPSQRMKNSLVHKLQW
jgi:hypothetical protein